MRGEARLTSPSVLRINTNTTGTEMHIWELVLRHPSRREFTGVAVPSYNSSCLTSPGSKERGGQRNFVRSADLLL